MLTHSDFIRLPYTPDLTEGGVEFALRSLAYSYEREGRSPYGRLRRLVANVAVEVAFRRHLSQNNIPFDVRSVTPFTDRERFDVVLGGRRCDIKSFLISHREQIKQIRQDPAVLLGAHALVPSDSHAGDGHSYDDIYLFAFMNGLVAASQADLQKAMAKKQPYYLVHVMPISWRKPITWTPLGELTLKSESAEELIVEINGQDAAREVKRVVVSLPPGGKVHVNESFHSITALHVRRKPEARVGIRCEREAEPHLIAPHDWSNIWVYGMDIFMVGYASYEEMGQRAILLPPNSRTFQYERTHVKNLSLSVSKLKPLKRLLDLPA